MHLVGDPEDNKISSAHSEDVTAHQRSASCQHLLSAQPILLLCVHTVVNGEIGRRRFILIPKIPETTEYYRKFLFYCLIRIIVVCLVQSSDIF